MAAPTLNTVIDAVEAVVVAALPVGTKVYDYFRLAKDDASLQSLFVTGSSPTARLHAWLISLAPSEPVSVAEARSPGCEQLDYRFLLHGYLSVEDADATEKTMRGYVSDLLAAFQASPKLGGGVSNLITAYHPTVPSWGWARLPADVGVLCHYVQIGIRARVST